MSAVVEDIRVRGVVLERLLEAVKRLDDITLLHVDACQLHPALCQRRDELHGSLEVFLRSRDISCQEPIRRSARLVGQSREPLLEGSSKVESLSLAQVPRDSLRDGLVYEGQRMDIIMRLQGAEGIK